MDERPGIQLLPRLGQEEPLELWFTVLGGSMGCGRSVLGSGSSRLGEAPDLLPAAPSWALSKLYNPPLK